MESNAEEQFIEYRKLLEKYESIEINVTEEKEELKRLEETLRDIISRNALKTKESKALKKQFEQFLIKLEEKNNYYFIITTTNYIKGILTNNPNIEECIKYIRNCLERIDNCNPEKINKQEKMLTEFYQIVLEVIKLEILIGKSETNTLLNYITSSENKIHLKYMEKAIEKDIDDIRNSSYVDINSKNNLENNINKKMTKGPFESLVDEEIIKNIIATNNHERLKEMIFENLRIYLKEIKSINETIQILKISLEESNNIKHFASKESKKRKIAITKVLAGLLGLLTPLSILYFKNTNKIIKLIGTEKILYETSTSTFSKNNIYSEACQNVLLNVTWEEKLKQQASRTLEVLGEVKIVDGKLARDYVIYDLSSYSFDLELPEYVKMYENGEITEDKIIKDDTKTASAEEYRYTDIVITETIQNLEKSKKEISDSEVKTGQVLLPALGILIDLIIVLLSLLKILSETKKMLSNHKTLKYRKKLILEENTKLINLLNINSEQITKYEKLCKDVMTLLTESELSQEQKDLLKELDTILKESNSYTKSLKLNG